MKKLFLYVILSSYSLLMLKPVIPYFSDAVAHVFWYSKHMATVHFVNGKFHVHKAVMEEEKRSGADKNPFSEKKEQSQNEHLIARFDNISLNYTIITSHFWSYSAYVLPFYLNADYPPPKVQSPLLLFAHRVYLLNKHHFAQLAYAPVHV